MKTHEEREFMQRQAEEDYRAWLSGYEILCAEHDREFAALRNGPDRKVVVLTFGERLALPNLSPWLDTHRVAIPGMTPDLTLAREHDAMRAAERERRRVADEAQLHTCKKCNDRFRPRYRDSTLCYSCSDVFWLR
jgi:hypothetical protein